MANVHKPMKNQPVGTREDVALKRLTALQMKNGGATLAAIGSALNVSKERARQLIKEGLALRTADAERVAELRRKCLQMRKNGMQYRKIGDMLGISDRRASQLVDDALTEVIQATEAEASKQKALELLRLDDALMVAMQILIEGKAADKLKAIDRVLSICRRRAELLGLDAPSKRAMTNADGTKSLLDLPASEMRETLMGELRAQGLDVAASMVEALDLTGDE